MHVSRRRLQPRMREARKKLMSHAREIRERRRAAGEEELVSGSGGERPHDKNSSQIDYCLKNTC